MKEQSRKSAGGFSLIELMIVVVIIGLLATIALPSYNSYIERSHRADAKAKLMEAAQIMERHFTNNNTYDGANLNSITADRYDITSAITDTTFTITATPVGTQSGDSCGTMTVTQTGQRTPANCWN